MNNNTFYLLLIATMATLVIALAAIIHIFPDDAATLYVKCVERNMPYIQNREQSESLLMIAEKMCKVHLEKICPCENK